MTSDNENLEKISKILALVGSILLVIEGLLSLFGGGLLIAYSSPLWGIGAIISGLILIALGIIVLSTYGVINLESLNISFEKSWLLTLIAGIIGIIFGGWFGGLLLIIAGVIDFTLERQI